MRFLIWSLAQRAKLMKSIGVIFSPLFASILWSTIFQVGSFVNLVIFKLTLQSTSTPATTSTSTYFSYDAYPWDCWFCNHVPCNVFHLLYKCRIERHKQRGAKNWEEHHVHAINAWNLRANNRVYGGAQHRDGPFNQYLDWLKQNTRLWFKVAMDDAYIEDLPSDPEDVFPEYDEITRSGR